MVFFESDPASATRSSAARSGVWAIPRWNGLTETAAGHCFRIAYMSSP